MSVRQRINKCVLHVAIYAQNLTDRITKDLTNAKRKKSATTQNNAGYVVGVIERTTLGQQTMSFPLTQTVSYLQHTDLATAVAEQECKKGNSHARR